MTSSRKLLKQILPKPHRTVCQIILDILVVSLEIQAT